MDQPRCRRCGCAHGSHNEDGTCRTRRATDWDEKAKVFRTQNQCDCPGYEGLVPREVSKNCPHEFLVKVDPHRCVHCKKFVSSAEQQKGAAK